MSHDQQYYVGHNKFYEQVCNLRFVTKQVFISCLFHLQVLVAKDPSLLGKMFDVVITETGKHYLKGDVLKESLAVVPARPAPLPFGAVSGMKTFKNQRTTSQEESSSTLTRLANCWRCHPCVFNIHCDLCDCVCNAILS